MGFNLLSERVKVTRSDDQSIANLHWVVLYWKMINEAKTANNPATNNSKLLTMEKYFEVRIN